MQDETKKIEEELLALHQNAKKEIAKIVNINNFSEKVYSLILSTLMKIEKAHYEIYEADPSKILEHSEIEFSIANANQVCEIFSLIKLTEVRNLPNNLNLDELIKEFHDNFLEIVKEFNANNKLQNFVVTCIEIDSFFNVVSMNLNNNAQLKSLSSTKGKEVSIIRILLNLED